MQTIWTKLMLLPVLLIFLTGCGNKDKRKDESRLRELAAIDSLLGVRGDGVSKNIDAGLRSAPDSMTWNEFYVRKAKYYGLSATPDSLLPIVDKIEKFAKHKTDTERGRQLLAYAYNTHAAYFHSFHLNSDLSISLYTKAYNLLMACEDKSQAPKVVANLGDAYAFVNDLPKAAKCYRRALYLVDSLGLPEKENVTLYLGFAGICQQLGDNDNAQKYFKQSEKNVGEMSVSMRAYFLNNFGNYYYYMRDYKQALEKFTELRRLLEHNGMENNFDMHLCKVNLADVYLNLDSLHEAKSCLDDVEPFAIKHGDPTMQYYCRTIRIGIAVKEHNWKKVEKLIAQRTLDESKMPFQLRQIRNRYLCTYYTSTGNYKQAFDDLLADRLFTDSLEHNRLNMRTADVMAHLSADTLRLHAGLRLEQQRSHTVKSRFVATIAIILALMFILLFIMLRLHSRKQQSDAMMKLIDLRLSNARNRFSPHFVFNVLNNYMISADKKDAEVLLKLTKFIRSGLDISRTMLSPLEVEIDHVNNYVNLEKPMAGEDFDYELSVDDGLDLKGTYAPSMMIQLMVENAFVHGLNGWHGHKELKVEIKKLQKGIGFIVTDNGPGFNPKSFRKEGHGLDIMRQTIAVLNSRNKQKITYGIVNVTDADGNVKGCRSTLTIPLNLKDLRNINNFKPAL